MPGIPTHFVVLEKAIAALAAAPEAALRDIATKISKPDNLPWAYLGVSGPMIGDFIPAGPGIVGQYVKVWHNLFDIIAGWGTPGHPGLLNIVNSMFSVLDDLDPIAAAEDQDALLAFEPRLQELSDAFGALANLLSELETRALRIVERINGSGPILPSTAPAAVQASNTWNVRDVLHWKKTGNFVKALFDKAGTDERFQAYAFGYLIAYCTNTTGAPFVNSIVRGPYRTAWWRHRFVQNWIDAWVFGQTASGATMTGDTPSPPYDDDTWSSLCSAQLEKKIELPGVSYDPVDLMNRLPKGFETEHSFQEHQPFPVLLPNDFGQFWVAAYSEAYGTPPPDSPVKAEKLNDAYIMLWLMLWFQTDCLGCNTPPPMTAPEGCEKPSWADPSVPGDDGSGTGPPVANPDDYEEVDTAEEVCGWILLILGILTGTPLVIGGVALIEDAHSVNWAKLRCDLFWYRQYFFNALELMHSVLLLGALDFPRAKELAVNQMTIPFVGLDYLSGANLCKSRDLKEGYPSKPWIPNPVKPGDWVDEPTQWEQPQTVAYLASEYPSFFVDSPANHLAPGKEVRIGGTWPPGYKLQAGAAAMALPASFANAVENAVDVIRHITDTFPEWNLDGDRGLAYLTWQFHNSSYTDPVAIDPES